MRILKRSRRVYDTVRFGQPQVRLRHRKGRGRRSPCYILQCGCCNQKLEIYYSEDGLEIGGVNGAIDDWREILLPLLLIKQKGGHLVDIARGIQRTACQQVGPASRDSRRRRSLRRKGKNLLQ